MTMTASLVEREMTSTQLVAAVLDLCLLEAAKAFTVF